MIRDACVKPTITPVVFEWIIAFPRVNDNGTAPGELCREAGRTKIFVPRRIRSGLAIRALALMYTKRHEIWGFHVKYFKIRMTFKTGMVLS